MPSSPPSSEGWRTSSCAGCAAAPANGRSSSPVDSTGCWIHSTRMAPTAPRVRVLTLLSRRRIWQAAVDGGLITLAWWLSFTLRFDYGIPGIYQRLLDRTIWMVVPIQLAVLIAFGIYNHWWRYVSIRDIWRI